MTPLMFAMMWAQADKDAPERLAVMTALVRAGADVRHEVPMLGTALDLATGAPDPGPLRAMLDGGVSPNPKPGSGQTPPLFRAANETSVENMRLLLDRGADVNARDALGTPTITHALRTMQLDQVEELLDRGADPRAVNLLGESFPYVLSTLMG